VEAGSAGKSEETAFPRRGFPFKTAILEVMAMKRWSGCALGALFAGAVFAAVEPLVRERGFRSERRRPVVWEPEADRSLLIKNAEVVDVLTGKVLHRRGILVEGGKIKDILTERRAGEVEADAVIDVRGGYVTPGLINGHCHLLLPVTLDFSPEVLLSVPRQLERNFEECVTHGVTTVRDAGTFPLLMDEYKGRVARGELLGPRVFSAGSIINAPGGYPSDFLRMPAALARKWGEFAALPRGESEVREAVRESVERGSAFIKTALDHLSLTKGREPLNIFDDAELGALVEEAHSRGLKVSAHNRFRAGFSRAVEFGLDGLEHVAGDELLAEKEAENFAAAGCFVVPTMQAAWYSAGVSREDPYLEDPLVRRALAEREEAIRSDYTSFCEPPVHRSLVRSDKRYRDPSFFERRGRGGPVFDPSIFTKAVVVGGENVKRLHRAGVLVGCGNDGGVPMIAPGDLGREIVLMVEVAEMDPLHVLQAATINNARILGVEEELGTLDRGKWADLVVFSGNPLEDIRTVLRPQAVFKEGKLLWTTHAFPVPGT
jgi:imidazolonepropionase-like amidohydrolase